MNSGSLILCCSVALSGDLLKKQIHWEIHAKISTNSILIKIIYLRHKIMIQQIQHWYCYKNDTIAISNQDSFSGIDIIAKISKYAKLL